MANSGDPLFDLEIYDSCKLEDDEADLEQLPAYVAVDMSLNGDLTAVVIAFRHPDGQISIRPSFFVPGED